ncbi:peptidoglycan DD-metalloendopeptidase family protein [Agrobacterium sp. Azo12]|uniref:peptidoglycan DD-metalloendopeptidase family protein n=1 Tax=Agrobacterium sp. Azo12 TaxID=3031129 RepID=UPI003F8D3229
MRMKNSPKIGKSVARVLVAISLAGVVTGCSSDATRFSGLFSNETDTMTTASIPSRNGAGAYGQAPIPMGDVNGSSMASAQPAYGNNNQNYNQPYQNNSGNYGSVQSSSARVASSPSTIQRSELTAPSAGNTLREPQSRNQAMAQPFPSANLQPAAPAVVAQAPAAPRAVDQLSTASTKPSSNGWNAQGGPSVTLRQGETIATLSKRYGVPEKEILKANGLTTASAAAPGQSITIPTFGTPRNAAKAAADNVNLANDGNLPAPTRQNDQNLAVLPSAAAARDKASGEAAKLTPPGGKPLPPTGGYKVQPGDSLAKIAKANGVSVAALKAANGLSNENIRIGQTLQMPSANTDNVKTASITPKETPVQPAAPAKTETAVKSPEPYKAPVATSTVGEIEKKSDVASIAPAATGIGKYRWPVRGAVISGFGENVDGNRNDGIDISVPEGTAIKAAENGVVIYSGNGLKQLGNTVLVRHDDGKVTVYGHASALNVQRGQKVQRGDTIATSGMSGSAKRPQVHFEVRKDATPVNPSGYLE